MRDGVLTARETAAHTRLRWFGCQAKVGKHLPACEGRPLHLHSGDERELVAEMKAVLREDVGRPQPPAVGVEIEKVQVIDEVVTRRPDSDARDKVVPANGGVELALGVHRLERVEDIREQPLEEIVISLDLE